MTTPLHDATYVYRDDGPRAVFRASSAALSRRLLGRPRHAFLTTVLSENDIPGVNRATAIRLVIRGYHPRAAILYDVDHYELEDYLSQYERERTRTINGPAASKVIDKYRFHDALESFPEHRSKIYGILHRGQFYSDLDVADSIDALQAIDERFQIASRLIAKPKASAGGGAGVTLIERTDSGYRLNDTEQTEQGVSDWLDQLENYLLTAFVQQSEYGDSLFPDSANTLRIVTMIDDAGPFIAAAVQRIGTSASAPVDNWSAGGLSAHVDDAGVLSAATRSPLHGDLQWFDEHPDTGVPIRGRSVPAWDDIRNRILAMTAALEDVIYLGWDVLPTEDGFTIIEGNAHIDVNSIQVHKPLLADRRVRAFYKRHGVLN